jgi:hypothetical protein
MLTRRRMSCAALILSAAACAGKSAAERIAEHDRVRESWKQTARMVGAEWIARAVPDAYAARTLARTSEELRTENEALSKDEIPEAERVRLRDALSVTRALTDSLERTVRARDRSAVAHLVKDSPRANADSLLRQAAVR